MKTACAWITVNMTVSFSFMDWILHSELIPKKNMKPNNHVPASMAGAVIDDLARTNKKKTENLVVLLAYCIRTLIDTRETIADTHS